MIQWCELSYKFQYINAVLEVCLSLSTIIFRKGKISLFARCLTPNADLRPDIIQVSSRISDIMMRFVDSLCTSHNSLERRAERDRKRAQKYFLENNRTRMCRPPQVCKRKSLSLVLRGDYQMCVIFISERENTR